MSYEIENLSLAVKNDKGEITGFADNKSLALVLQAFITPSDEKILAQRGFPEPTLKERALWAAYGLFNSLDPVVDDENGNALVRLLDFFIAKNGGWNYFGN